MPITKPSFIILDSVDSTNNYAMAKVRAGLAKHGDAYFALEQTGGKGQRGKKWHTGNGENIALSIVIEPSTLKLQEQFKLSAIVALACADFFAKYAGQEVTIKWPNDIYWRDRKAGGILIENVIGTGPDDKKKAAKADRPYWKYAVVGIGLNINQSVFDDDLKAAISLKQITGQHFAVTDLAKQLHLLLLASFNDLLGSSFEKVLQLYNAILFKKNQTVQLKKGNIVFATTIKEVIEDGRLFTVDLIDNLFEFGEVEWVL